MESQRLNEHNISIAIRQLAEVIADGEIIDGCSLEQTRVKLNVVSDIISNVAQYVLKQPSNETFDSTVRSILYHQYSMQTCIIYVSCNSYYWLLSHSRLSMDQQR